MNRIGIPIIFISIIFTVFVVSLIFVALVLWPRYQELSALKQDIKAREEGIAQEEKYLAGLNKNRDELKNYELELSLIEDALPQESFLPALFDYLQEAAPQSGVILQGIGSYSISPSSQDPNIKETRLSLTVDGSYSSLKTFLNTLENSARLFEVESIGFSSPQKKEQPFTFNLQIKVSSY